MNSNILSALGRLDVASLSYEEWLNVGFALKQEGFDWTVWDSWSKNDVRYKPGECERKWYSFRGTAKPVTGATIIAMAKDRGWTSFGEDGVMGWNDTIDDDSEYRMPVQRHESWSGVEDFKTYLKTLFLPDDRVGYVTNDAWQDKSGEWNPGRGQFDRTAGELLQSLELHPDDLGATIGDWKEGAGAWIRFNPVDGIGVKNENVTAFRYALVESDEMPISDQEMLYRKLELPIATLTHSGGKSLHAIVHIDAPNYDEYRKRVDKLYTFLQEHGMKLDKQNRNPSRLSRLPGVTREGNRQYLVATNIGRASWNDWLDYLEGNEDTLPAFETLADYNGNPPKLPEELIKGVLRCGHKMLISGSSKAGKSFLLMELCIALAEGRKWLSFDCRKSKVLYVNLEIDPASCINRFLEIYKALGIEPMHMEDITVWNLRGHAIPLDQLVPKLVRRIRDLHYDAVIIDPIYKVITGDENNASDMGAFCNQFDKICAEAGCAAIYCHHHSKGAQGQKRAMDRASGSGVFARDPDAQLDMIEVEMDDVTRVQYGTEESSPWRLEASLREFKPFKPVEFWFRYPLHVLDECGALKELPSVGTMEAGKISSGNRTHEQCAEQIRTAYDMENMDGNGVSVKDLAAHLGIAERTVRDRLKKMPDEFKLFQGMVIRLTNH